MQSNSKLTDLQKQFLKAKQLANPDVKFATMGKTTIAFKRVGNLVEFSTAICADNEKKNRPKVGKYYALTRFTVGDSVKLTDYQFDDMLESAFWD